VGRHQSERYDPACAYGRQPDACMWVDHIAGLLLQMLVCGLLEFCQMLTLELNLCCAPLLSISGY
jgi:hypothetical protein